MTKVTNFTGIGLSNTNSTDPDTDGEIRYVDGTGFRFQVEGTVYTIPTSSGGGGSVGTLDGVYENGQTIDLDRGAVAFTDATTGAVHSFSITQTGAKSGNLIDLSVDAAMTGDAIAVDMNLGTTSNALFVDNGATARTGSDILVTDDSTGAHSVIDINSSGSGASVGFDWTGSYTGSPGGSAISITQDADDNLDTNGILYTAGSGVRTAPFINVDDSSTGNVPLIDIDMAGVYTGGIIDVAFSGAATGDVLTMNLDNAVATTGIHMEGSGVRTVPFLEIITDSTSSADLVDISVDGAITGDAISIDMNLGLAAKAIYIDAGAGTRTDDLISIKDDGDGNVDAFAVTASNTGSGSVFDIDMTGTRTGSVMDIDMDAAVGCAVFTIDGGAGTRTVDMIDVTFDGAGNVGFIDLNCTNTGSGDLFDVDVTGVHTGNILDLAYSSAASTGSALVIDMGTNLAGNAIALTTAGARTAPVFLVTGAGTDAGTDDHIFDINQTGALDSNVFDVTYSSGASTGNAIDLNMGTNVAGMAISVGSAATGTSGEGSCLDVAHTGDLGAGADVVRIHSTGSPSATSNLLSIEQDTGAGSAGAFGLYINTTGTNVEAIKVDAGTVTFDETLLVTGITTLTGGSVNGAKWIRGGTGAITTTSGPGAVAVTGSVHEVTTTGTGDALTLANGTAGQRLSILYVAEGAGADTAVLTPTTLAGGTTITFNNVGDTADLIYSSTGGWHVLGLGGAAAVA